MQNLIEIFDNLVSLAVKQINGSDATNLQNTPNPLIKWTELASVLKSLKIEMYWEGSEMDSWKFTGASLKEALTSKLEGININEWALTCYTGTWKNIGIAIRNALVNKAVSCQTGESDFKEGVYLSFIAGFKARRMTGWM